MSTIDYIQQAGLANNSCGAFALAYWHWATTGTTPEDDKAHAIVTQIYNLIRFDGNTPVMGGKDMIKRDYSNPVSMICLMELAHFGNKECKFYTGLDDAVLAFYGQMKKETDKKGELIANWKTAGRVVKQILPAPAPGKYAICLCAVNGDSTNLHYVLVRKITGEDETEQLQTCNSWSGTWKDIDDGFMSGTEDLVYMLDRLTAVGAGIYIP